MYVQRTEQDAGLGTIARAKPIKDGADVGFDRALLNTEIVGEPPNTRLSPRPLASTRFGCARRGVVVTCCKVVSVSLDRTRKVQVIDMGCS